MSPREGPKFPDKSFGFYKKGHQKAGSVNNFYKTTQVKAPTSDFHEENSENENRGSKIGDKTKSCSFEVPALIYM